MSQRIKWSNGAGGRSALIRRRHLVGLLLALLGAITLVAPHRPSAVEAPQQSLTAALQPFVDRHTLAGG